MSGIDHILVLAREYGRAEKLEASTVSWRVFGDTKKLGAIETGSDIQVRRYERALVWFSENWPASAVWPAQVPRSAPASEREAV